MVGTLLRLGRCCYGYRVREAELWSRLNEVLGVDYARAWAEMTSITGLNSRTVLQALADGVPCKTIWRAVWEFMELPEKLR